MPMTQHTTGSQDLLLAYTHPSRHGTAGQVGQAEVDTIESGSRESLPSTPDFIVIPARYFPCPTLL